MFYKIKFEEFSWIFIFGNLRLEVMKVLYNYPVNTTTWQYYDHHFETQTKKWKWLYSHFF